MSRQLNALEKRIHAECMSKPNKVISQKEVDALAPDSKSRIDAINFLLKAGMFVVMADKHQTVSYRAVTKNELNVKKEISGDENLVLQAIQAAKNEGIWTKHLKTKTELHQTVITRCLKSLEQKGLIKTVKSVKFPTRKIYMMSHLEPSVEVTGGPWYTDHEFDTEFIRLLVTACHRFIADRSFPKDTGARPLYPISHGPSYASASSVLSFLQKSRITETDLQLEHVEALLDVLVYDGLIERLPAFGSLSWGLSMAKGDDDDDDESDDDAASSKKKKSKKKEKAKDKKRKRRKDDSDDESSEDERPKKKKKTKKNESSDEDDSDNDASRKKKKKKGKKKADTSDDEESDDDSHRKKKKKASASKKRKRESSPPPTDSEDDDGSSKRRKKRKRRDDTSSESGSGSAESSDEEDAPVSRSARKASDSHAAAAHVYRAIRQEHVEPLQAFSQAPCTQCPQFDFCDSAGPVNPKGCEYFTTWLAPENTAF